MSANLPVYLYTSMCSGPYCGSTGRFDWEMIEVFCFTHVRFLFERSRWVAEGFRMIPSVDGEPNVPGMVVNATNQDRYLRIIGRCWTRYSWQGIVIGRVFHNWPLAEACYLLFGRFFRSAG